MVPNPTWGSHYHALNSSGIVHLIQGFCMIWKYSVLFLIDWFQLLASLLALLWCFNLWFDLCFVRMHSISGKPHQRGSCKTWGRHRIQAPGACTKLPHHSRSGSAMNRPHCFCIYQRPCSCLYCDTTYHCWSVLCFYEEPPVLALKNKLEWFQFTDKWNRESSSSSSFSQKNLKLVLV